MPIRAEAVGEGRTDPRPTNFRVRAADYEPAYLRLHRSGELARRAEAAVASLSHCLACPRDCGVDRLAGRTAVCRTGRYARVASYGPHHGEEDCLRGRRGSGTIFFSMCNLRCVFCQNHDISQTPRAGVEVTPQRLAAIMLELQALGCHNINFVTPEHIVPQILEALPIAVETGLRLPLVYNTSAYDALESLTHMDGIIDIYMPDFKIWDPAMARLYLKAENYPEAARRAIQEMHRQVGPLVMDEDGVAQRGVLVRHLVMPEDIAGTAAIMRFLAHDVSPDTYVNIMDQYRPSWRVGPQTYSPINRRVSAAEFDEAFAAARLVGLSRLDKRQSRPFENSRYDP